MAAISDLVHETSATTGTGNLTVAAVNGKRTFNTAFGTGGTDLFNYYISNRDAAEWEWGTGHLFDATTLVRDTVVASSNAGSLVSFSAGTKDVANDLFASVQDRLQNLTGIDADLVTGTAGTSGNLGAWDANGDMVDAGVSIESVASPPQGRLSLTTATPVTTSDVAAATTVYYTPYIGQRVPIYDGTRFIMTNTGGELSQATTDTTKSPAAVTTNSNYDVFVWNDSGTIRATRGPAWSSDTARGTGVGTTELERVNGIYVNKIAITNGPAAQRGTYVGTIRSNGTSTIDDTQQLRHVWNAYNRARREFELIIATVSWTYSTNSYRQVQGSSTYQVSYVCGLVSDSVELSYDAIFNHSSSGNPGYVAIGVNSTTVGSGVRMVGNFITSYSGKPYVDYRGPALLGYNYLALLENGAGTATNTWYGTVGETRAGARGSCFA